MTWRRRYPHLPEGHEPGAQTRRRYGIVQWVMRFVFLVLALASVGLGVMTAVLAAKAEDGSLAVVLGAFAIVVGVTGIFLLRWALQELKRAMDRPASHLRLMVSPVDVRRGDRLTATLTLTDLAKVEQDEVQVGLVCTEWYEVDDTVVGSGTVRVTTDDVAYEEWVPAERRSDPQPFTFSVPADAPFSYEGNMLSFGWRVAARQVSPERPPAKQPGGTLAWRIAVALVTTRRVGRIGPTTNLPIWVRP